MTTWRRSSRCGDPSGNGTCIEVADLGEGVRGIRDSTDPGGPHLQVTPQALASLVQGIKTGG